jgi:hypothetical protein
MRNALASVNHGFPGGYVFEKFQSLRHGFKLTNVNQHGSTSAVVRNN